MPRPYESYDAIPPTIAEYLLTVAEEKCIMNMSLEEINSFLQELDEFYKNKEEKFEDGWVE